MDDSDAQTLGRKTWGEGQSSRGHTLDRQRRKESAFQVGSSVRKGRGRAGKTFSGESEQAQLIGRRAEGTSRNSVRVEAGKVGKAWP